MHNSIENISGITWPPEGVRRVPYAVYSDEAIFRQEQESIFRGPIWHFLGLEAQIPEPGCFVTAQVGETPVILVRDQDGAIQALVNRCSHKGTQLAFVPWGKVDQFMCVYHNWCYDLRGKLLSAAFERGVRGAGTISAIRRCSPTAAGKSTRPQKCGRRKSPPMASGCATAP